jgi:hypothetical protein
MAICNSCGEESRQIKTVFEVGGKPLPAPKDECENCASGGIHMEPAWARHKPTPLWESRPHLYRKKDNPDGGDYYQPTDENLADLEAQLTAPAIDDVLAVTEAVEHKRQNRRTAPLTGDELKQVLARAHRMAAECVESHNETVKQHVTATEEYWNDVAGELNTIQ